MSFIAKDVIRRNGGDLNMQTLEDLQNDATALAALADDATALGALADDATALGALADTAITTTQTGVAMLSSGAVQNRLVKIAKKALAAVDTGGGVLSWQNPEGVDILITRIVLDVTTASTGACAVDVGTTTVGATTSSDNLIDGVSVATAGVIDNAFATTLGDNGKPSQKLAAGKWVTASKSGAGASAGLVGSAYIHYILA